MKKNIIDFGGYKFEVIKEINKFGKIVEIECKSLDKNHPFNFDYFIFKVSEDDNCYFAHRIKKNEYKIFIVETLIDCKFQALKIIDFHNSLKGIKNERK